MAQDQEIIYVYDALCGWCYGFSEVIKKIAEKYGKDIHFTVLSGGMIIGERIGPIANMAKYIEKAYKTVEDHTGIKFGEAFLSGILKNPDYISNSENPSIALTAFKTFQPENAIGFAHAIQKAFYFEGKSLNEQSTYLELIKPYQIPEKDFMDVLEDEKTLQTTRDEFAQSMEWGITGFPTLLYKNEDKLYALVRGYKDFESVDGIFKNILANQPG